MEEKPLVSIITPVYRVESFLDRCIQSVISQTYTNWELILIDDGSPDRSGDICEEWSKRDPRILTFHKNNEGVSEARNYGIDKSKGRFVMFLDSDDWLANNCVEKCVLEMNKNILDVLQFNFFYTYNNGKVSKNSSAYSDICSLDEYVSAENKTVGLCVWQGIYQRELIEKYKIRFDKRMRYGEDGVFVCTALYYSMRIKHIPEPLYFYYMNPKSVMHKKNVDAYLDSLQIQLSFLDSHPIFGRIYGNLITMIVGSLCTFGIKRSQRKRLKEFWYSHRDDSPYINISEYHHSRSIEYVFLPLQAYSFTLAWFFTALVTALHSRN